MGLCSLGRPHCIKLRADLCRVSANEEVRLSAGRLRGVQHGKQIEQHHALDLCGNLCRGLLRGIRSWTTAGEV